jgi:hypothetical protein
MDHPTNAWGRVLAGVRRAWSRNTRPPAGASAGSVPFQILDAASPAPDLRLVLFCDAPAATQHVHLFRPLKRLRLSGRCEVAIVTEKGASAASSAEDFAALFRQLQPAAIIFSRFGGEQASIAIDGARSAGVPVITHLDDYLLEVPAELGADKVRRHNRPERIAAIRATLDRADLLFISTEPLAARLRRAGVQTRTIVAGIQSGAAAGECVPPVERAPGSAFRIGYQGTRNHGHDLGLIVPQIIKTLDAAPEATFELFGTIETPKELERFGARVVRHGAIADYEGFLDCLKPLGWHVGLAPLRALEFNTFRTYTKWVEYTIAGVPMIASPGVVYEGVLAGGAGIIAPDDGWADAILRLRADDNARLAMAAAAQARLLASCSLDQMEAQVLDVLRAAGAKISV